ncbi:HAD-IB family phosphatase [Pseudonocardia xishanensis]|uniref:Phosphoserine phosphatase n=1 Tax=Pseudonocardia xishanensis TaxID=630995 RepID=A0ABP8S0Y8_9PSEU
MSRLHVFDMDGTLLRSAATVELSRYLGSFAQAHAIEQAWERGEIEGVEFWSAVLPLWLGASEPEIDAAFEAARWISGVREVFADIRARGEHAVVISQSPHFFVHRLERWGAHRAVGASVRPGVVPQPSDLVSARRKVDLALGIAEELGLTHDDCVAYGDSRSDVLLFERLSHTVGVNPTALLRGRCAAVYDGEDLRGAYALGRELLDGTVP